MADLISRAAALNVFMSKPPDYYHSSYIVDEINRLPTVEAEPVRQESEGVLPKMDEIEWDTQFVVASCGACGKRVLGRSEDITNYFRYCPTCGMKVKWDDK